MVTYPQRIRYTHRVYFYYQINTVFTGLAAVSMTIVGYPTREFHLAVTASAACRIKITGTRDGAAVVERISFAGAGTSYTINSFDSVTALASGYYEGGTTFVVDAVDSVGMPVSWQQTFGPYRAEFGQMGGMSAQVEANALGLGSKIVHYVRVERRAPVAKDMMMSVVGYDDQLFVPVSDIENISTPPSYIAQEWAFRVVKKQDGDT